MDNFIYINACKTTLANEITDVQTTIQVSNPGRFPASIPLGQVLVLTIHPDGLPSTQEIVHCTAISGASLTVVRGAQSTAAAPWPAGSVIGAYLTAEMLRQIADDVNGHAGSGGSAHSIATTVAAGFMSAANLVKLNGIQAGATNYQHPITHSPTIIAQDPNNRFATDAEKANWNAAKNHADSPHAPSDAQKNSDITKSEIEARLTGELIPPGKVGHFAMASAPTGWLKANGAAISRTTYSALFAAIGTTFGAGNGTTTFNVPDLRGEFVRGFDDARGVDSGRGFGSWQGDQNKSHAHTGTAQSAGTHTHSFNDVAGQPSDPNRIPGFLRDVRNGAVTRADVIHANGAHTHTLAINASGDGEARPKNIALLFCIKY